MIVRQNVTQKTIEYLKDRIVSGDWAMGDKIPSENELCATLGVSRTSVRIAIRQFIAVGVLESIHGKGTFLRSNNLSTLGSGVSGIPRYQRLDLKEVLQFRLILEPGASVLAVQNATEENIRRLQDDLERMKENVGNSEEFVKYDMLFHEEICLASGNRLLARTAGEVFRNHAENHKRINRVFGYQDGIYYHTCIFKAIAARDAKLTEKYMREHLEKALKAL